MPHGSVRRPRYWKQSETLCNYRQNYAKKKNGLRHTTNKCATVNHHCYKSSVTFKEIKGPFTQAKGTKEISILIITKVVLHLKIPEG